MTRHLSNSQSCRQSVCDKYTPTCRLHKAQQKQKRKTGICYVYCLGHLRNKSPQRPQTQIRNNVIRISLANAQQKQWDNVFHQLYRSTDGPVLQIAISTCNRDTPSESIVHVDKHTQSCCNLMHSAPALPPFIFRCVIPNTKMQSIKNNYVALFKPVRPYRISDRERRSRHQVLQSPTPLATNRLHINTTAQKPDSNFCDFAFSLSPFGATSSSVLVFRCLSTTSQQTCSGERLSCRPFTKQHLPPVPSLRASAHLVFSPLAIVHCDKSTRCEAYR